MRYSSSMANKSTSVRVDEDTLERLRKLSAKSGVSISKLIILATMEFVKKVDKTGSIEVPVKGD